MRAACFVLAMENLAFLANASNLVTYLTGSMHFSPARAANAVTTFMGTAFLLALLGGFLSDAFYTSFRIYLISAVVEFLGLVILTIQARTGSLKPPECHLLGPSSRPCEEVSGGKAALLFAGLYLVALGVGGIKGSLPAHGAEQFDEETTQGRKSRSTFFNYFVFFLSLGALVAVTFVVWLEDNKGWQWGFGISTVAVLLSFPVFLAGSATYRNKTPTGSPSPLLRGAMERKPIHQALAVTVEEVEEVKVVVKILPIFLSTIMLSCCLAQLSTFSVQQAATMDTRLGSLTVPPASLPVFPIAFIMVVAPLYDHIIVPFARKMRGTESGITQLQRIGVGLVLSVLAMAVAALVEVKRKRVASLTGTVHSAAPLPITFLWVALQYLFLGSADLFTLAGLLEFFFTEAPSSMRSLATSLSWASLAIGYYLSSILVSIVNSVTNGNHQKPWLAGGNLNSYRLESFYWLMCILSTINFLHFLFWSSRFKYRPALRRG
ncbi:unnamed protein product [Spirodela intermedia]|uniref:Major facilitator superfamily (MFS) profile domain-containing protein n=1 Tax=Spirodela intermedia TaxID=51605 RepID=A0A7I8J9S8_SPIIN|nr:unnamed protein product [Spirodela intermedia]CAA6666203.1 unnamed protein product [Spirodela intermedia]